MNVNEIKEALSKATPGPWTYQEGGYARAHVVYEDATDNHVCSFKTHPGCVANGHLIANSPEWLASLIEHYEELNADAIVLHWQVEEMQKTLEWYAEESNYEMVETSVNAYSTETTSATWQDSGERARRTLQSLKGATK